MQKHTSSHPFARAYKGRSTIRSTPLTGIRNLLCLGLAIVPLAYLVFLIATSYIDVPYWDQWGLVPLLDNYYQGTLSIHDFWTMHLEHRMFFPRLIMVLLAVTTYWNIGYELAVSVALAIATLIAIIYQVRQTAARIGIYTTVWLMPPLSLLLFSLTQWENWLWGWQIQIFLNVLTVVLGTILLCQSQQWIPFVGALVLGVVAAFSFANGLIYWLIGPLLLVVTHDWRSKHLWLKLGIWLLVGGLVITSYVFGYQRPPSHPSAWTVLEQPIAYAKYVVAYLGAPIGAFYHRLAYLFGLLGGGALLVNAWIVAQRTQLRVVAPYVAWGLYAIGSAAITGVGRVGLGIGQALSSRYMTFGTLLWIANIILLYFMVSTMRRRVKWINLAALGAMVMLLLSLGVNTTRHQHFFVEHREAMAAARAAILTSGDPEAMKQSFPEVEAIIMWSEVLREHQLSLFRTTEPP